MTTDRFAALRALFDQLLDLPDADREARARELTDDAELIAKVLVLCRAADDKSTTQFARPLNAMLQSATRPDLKPGDTLGVWRIVREIGHGGMGSVFLVERTDGHFTQTAALKFVKGMPRADTLAYFTRERQMLATLTHPNIARLLDGGATRDGQPYLVMEYVDGLPVDQHCQRHQLGVAAILKLFSTACAAVAFSHRQLIVHCDLKPSNLLIDQEGRPVLLDFGIAKLLDRVGQDALRVETDAVSGADAASPPSTATTYVATVTPFTPRYASPEQRESGAVTTASDIFSLGVLLRELIEAAPDGDLKSAKSTSLRARELAAILNKASHDDPAQRYPSVDALTDDIQHYLDGQPVRAMESAASVPPLYVTRKLLVRRWPVAVAAAVFVLTVAGFTFKVIGESNRARAAEQQALADRDRAQAAEQRAIAERDATRAAQAEALRERDGAQRARNEALTAQAAATMERDRAKTSESRAVGERNRAAQAENAAKQAEAAARQAETAAKDTSNFLISVFDSSVPNAQTSDIPASKLLAAAEARLDKDLAGQPATQAELFRTLAVVQQSMGNPNQAKANYRRSIEIERKQNRPLVLASMLHQSALMRITYFSAAEAEADAREALQLRQRHMSPDAIELAHSLATMGHVLSILNKFDEAEKLLVEASATLETKQPATVMHESVLIQFAQHSMRVGKPTRALEQFRKGIALSASLHGDEHPDYLDSLELYIRALNQTRHHEEAEKHARRALALRRKQDGNETENVASALNELARILSASSRIRESVPLFEEALAIRAKRSGTDSALYGVALNNLALTFYEMDDIKRTEAPLRDAYRVLKKHFARDDTALARVQANLGRVQLILGMLEPAYANLSESESIRVAKLKEDHTARVESRILMAEWQFKSGNVKEAMAILEKAKPFLPTMNPLRPAQHQRVMAMCLAAQNQPDRLDEAISLLQSADATHFEVRGSNSVEAWIAVVDHAELLARRNGPGDKQAAAALAARAIEKTVSQLAPESLTLARLKRLAAI